MGIWGSHSKEVVVHLSKLCRSKVKPALGAEVHCVRVEDVFVEVGDPGVDVYDSLRVIS